MKLKKISKQSIIKIIIVVLVLVSIATPTLSRFNNGIDSSMNLVYWDGSIAEAYSRGEGTAENPYIINNGSEFAFFSNELLTTTYKDVYFRLGNDIILNKGFFVYEDDFTKYIVDEQTYYLKPYTTELYLDQEFTELSDEVLYSFQNIENFEGHLDGNYFSIYGTYIESETADELAIFNNISGSIENIYIENTLITGGDTTAGLAVNANNFTLINAYLSGYVVSSKNITDIEETIEFANVNLTTSLNPLSFSLTNTPDLEKETLSTTLSGTYLVDNYENLNYELKINGEVISIGDFKIELNNVPISELKITTSEDLIPRNASLINLKYEVVYEITSGSGIISNADNVTINNSVNSNTVHNLNNSSGFINLVKGPARIINSYNTGKLYSEYETSGLISDIKSNDVVIDKVYNSGQLLGTENYGLVKAVEVDKAVSISNSFNVDGNYLYKNISSLTAIDNSYGSQINGFDGVQLADYTKVYTNEFIDSLSFGDFSEDAKVEDNVWIFSEGKLPELFFVNEVNLIDIRVNNDAWNNSKFQLLNSYYNEELTVSVTSSAPVYTLKSAEYFVKYDNVALTKDELSNVEWIPYDGSFTLSDVGSYIIYVKLTDYADEVRYINTDVITIDKTLPTAMILFKDNEWHSYRNDIVDIFTLENSEFTINASDDSSGIDSISYHVADEVLTEDELSKLNDANWTEYDNSFTIPAVGNNVVYAKVSDNSGNAVFLNSDMITYDGYHMNYLKAGQNNLFASEDSINITKYSSITANYIYNVPLYDEPSINHRVNFNMALPHGTVIVLTDNVTGKKYDYRVVNATPTDFHINFTDFSRIGSTINNYEEETYSNGTNFVENFTITLNFVDAVIMSDIIGLRMWMEVASDSGVVVRETAPLSIKEINVYTDKNASLYFNSSTSVINISSGTDAITSFNVNTGVTHQVYNGNVVYDTLLEEQDIVLQFKLLNEFNIAVSQSQLSNFLLKVDDITYLPDSNGVFTINLKSGIQNIDRNIEIYTYKGDLFLSDGSYNLEMTSYVSYSNNISSYIATTPIPLIVNKAINSSNLYFKSDFVSDQLIYKEIGIQNIDINNRLTGAVDPKIVVSLYKKDEYNALSQTYSLVDLNSYLTAPLLTSGETNKYYVQDLNFSLNIDASLFDNQAYKIVIDAYDGDTYVASSEKYFIVK